MRIIDERNMETVLEALWDIAYNCGIYNGFHGIRSEEQRDTSVSTALRELVDLLGLPRVEADDDAHWDKDWR